jgi:glycosyltransferase involved in cell wall biosynthesis
MKFSVLLPTRNRLELLRYALETVRRQDYEDWEVIVSDNASQEDIEGHVRSLGDARIQYRRTAGFVPVTENWNNALAHSSGDYVVMLGDDDGLMKGYFSTLRGLIEGYRARGGVPELVYHSALLYAYPGVMPGFPDGFLQPYGYAEFLKGAREPFWLERARALRCVRKSMRFQVSFGFNMQFALVSRGLIARLAAKGPFYQSPYPDYYAMNAALLEAQRILVCPQALVAIGISAKSFGYYYVNRAEQSGVEFLNNAPDGDALARLEHVLLPGSEMNNAWLMAMQALRDNFAQAHGLEVDYRRYRLLQLFQNYVASAGEAPALFGRLSLREKCLAVALRALGAAARRLPAPWRQRLNAAMLVALRVYPLYRPRRVLGRYRNMLEVHEGLQRDFLGQYAP